MEDCDSEFDFGSAGLTGEESFDLERGRGASGGLVIVYKRTLAFRSEILF